MSPPLSHGDSQCVGGGRDRRLVLCSSPVHLSRITGVIPDQEGLSPQPSSLLPKPSSPLLAPGLKLPWLVSLLREEVRM